MAATDELLALSAPLAWKWSRELCVPDPKLNCSATHGVWQYLRLLGLLGTLETRGEFYAEATGLVAACSTSPRVLICGAADYGLLELLLRGASVAGITPRVTVIDLCATPLALNRWYAQHIAHGIETLQTDIFDFAPSILFDAIYADFFLSRFPASRREALLTQWRALLRPGGVVVTATRLRPTIADTVVNFSPQQIDKLRNAVLAAATAADPPLAVPPGELAARAVDYARGYRTHTVHSAHEVIALFEGAGFATERSTTSGGPPASGQGVTGPTMRDDLGQYMTLIARRL